MEGRFYILLNPQGEVVGGPRWMTDEEAAQTNGKIQEPGFEWQPDEEQDSGEIEN